MSDNIFNIFSFGLIAPKVKPGQRWMLDSDFRNHVNDFCIVDEVVNGIVTWHFSYEEYGDSSVLCYDAINDFRWTRTLVG